MRFQDKVAMVTGAGHGIGAAIAARLASEGAQVLVCDIDEARAREGAEKIGGQVCVIDVAQRGDVQRAVDDAVSRWSRLDILVCSAGVMDREPFLEASDAHWEKVSGINLRGTFLCGQIVARQMVAQASGGRIVNVASNSGAFGGSAKRVPEKKRNGQIRTKIDLKLALTNDLL